MNNTFRIALMITRSLNCINILAQLKLILNRDCRYSSLFSKYSTNLNSRSLLFFRSNNIPGTTTVSLFIALNVYCPKMKHLQPNTNATRMKSWRCSTNVLKSLFFALRLITDKIIYAKWKERSIRCKSKRRTP